MQAPGTAGDWQSAYRERVEAVLRRALPAESRTLILEYYQDQRRLKIDRRIRLAAELGLTAQALRSRAQRVRDRLERCVRGCSGGPAEAVATAADGYPT